MVVGPLACCRAPAKRTRLAHPACPAVCCNRHAQLAPRSSPGLNVLQYLVDICMTEVGAHSKAEGVLGCSIRGRACMLHMPDFKARPGCPSTVLRPSGDSLQPVLQPFMAHIGVALRLSPSVLTPYPISNPLSPSAEEGVGVPQGGSERAARLQAPLRRLRQLHRAAVRRVPACRPADCGQLMWGCSGGVGMRQHGQRERRAGGPCNPALHQAHPLIAQNVPAM